MGMAQAMKNPTIAPLRLITMVTSTSKKVRMMQKMIITTLQPQNIFFLFYYNSNCQRNSFLVMKLRMGITERFCTKMPNWTTLPKTKKTLSMVSVPLGKQSKIVEQWLECWISLALDAQVSPPKNPTYTQISAVRPYPSSRSLMLFSCLIFLLSTGAATGCMRKLRAKVPATVLKSGLNKVYCSEKFNSPLANTLIKATKMNIPQANTKYMVNLKNFMSNSMSRLQMSGAVKSMQMMQAYCGEYLERLMPLPVGGLYPSMVSEKMAAVMSKKLPQTSMKQADETTKRRMMLTALLHLAHLLPKIRLMLILKSISSFRLCSTSSRQVKKSAAPMMSSTRSDPSIPSWMKMMGKTMMLEPIMVLAMDVITLNELSPPFSITNDFLRLLIFYLFMSSGMCFSASTIPICTVTCVEFYSIIIILFKKGWEEV